MSPKIRYCLFCIFILLFLSCNNNTDQLVYHKVERTTFSDVLQVSGSVNAKNSSTVSSPLRYDLTIVSIVDDGTVVKMGDTICVLENKELLNQYNTLLTSVEGAKAQYNKSKANLNLNFAILEAQVKNNEAQTSITNLDSLEIIYLSDQQRKIKEIELKIASIEKAKYESKLAFLKLINASELKKQELIIRRNENRAQNIKSDLDKMIITAPRDGLALRSRSWMTGNKLQPGDQVWGTAPIIDLPDLSVVQVAFQATESDYRRISVNDSVTFTFDAMPGNNAWGKIIRKAPVGKPISRGSRIKYFEITASVDSFKVLPEVGLSANCLIALAMDSNKIVLPHLAVFDHDSMKVVYVKKGSSHFEMRQVLQGQSSPTNTIISAGLDSGEVVTLVKPDIAKVQTTQFLPDSLTDIADNKTHNPENSKINGKINPKIRTNE